MPYTFSWPENTFLATFSGRVTAEDIERVNHAFSGDARMESVRYSIWDFSLAESIQMPVSEIENAAAFDKGATYARHNLRGALICTNEAVKQKLEMYLDIANDLEVNWDTRIFESIQSARCWLDS